MIWDKTGVDNLFSARGQIVNIFSFGVYMIDANTQLCSSSEKTDIANT